MTILSNIINGTGVIDIEMLPLVMEYTMLLEHEYDTISRKMNAFSKTFEEDFPFIVESSEAKSVAEQQLQQVTNAGLPLDKDTHHLLKDLFHTFVKLNHPDVNDNTDVETFVAAKDAYENDNFLLLLKELYVACNGDVNAFLNTYIKNVDLSMSNEIRRCFKSLMMKIQFIYQSVAWRYYMGTDSDKKEVVKFMETFRRNEDK